MPDIISEYQNAFVKGRLISDNIIIAGELVNFLRTTKAKKGYWAALKVDLFKAFDKLSWSFLEETLKYMEFPPHWINLIMQCISTTLCRISFNGVNSRWIKPECGIRQGDPMSPYLFILCMNILSHTLLRSQENTPRRLQRLMSKAIKCKIVPEFKKYLGCLIDETLRSKAPFLHIKETLLNILQSWKGRFLSQVGRITLIKSTLQELPIHQLSFLKLTKQEAGTCDSIIRNFLWGKDRKQNKIPMINWAKICRPMGQGGLNIRKMEDLNCALLAKQIWRIFENEHLLFSKVLRAKYGGKNDSEFFRCPTNASKTWK